MKKSVSTFINKESGEGFLTIDSAIFNTSKRRAKAGYIVLIVDPIFSFGEYDEGDILKVLDVDEDALDGSIYAKTQVKESLIFQEEYLVLVPQNLDAAVLVSEMFSVRVTKKGVERTFFEEEDGDEFYIDDEPGEGCPYFDEDWVRESDDDEYPEVCEGCDRCEWCYETEHEKHRCDGCPGGGVRCGQEGCVCRDELFDDARNAIEDEPLTMGAAEQFLIEIGALPMSQKFLRVKALNTLKTCCEPIQFKGEKAIAEFVELKYGEILALIRRVNDGKIVSYGMAQCNPDDVFFLEIGKVIALYRAGGKEVPIELIRFATYKLA